MKTLAPGFYSGTSSGYAQVLKAEKDSEVTYYTRGFELISKTTKNGASTWKDFPDPNNWKNGVLDALYDPNTDSIFNLDGIDNPYSAVQRAASGYGGATDWELNQIKLTPESWDRITWYANGKIVSNPFA